jgi:hypothetical protein
METILAIEGHSNPQHKVYKSTFPMSNVDNLGKGLISLCLTDYWLNYP